MSIRSFFTSRNFTVLVLLLSKIIFGNAETINNMGTVGLSNNPTARFHSEGSVSMHLVRQQEFSRINIVAQPYEWAEFSIFYADVFEGEYPASINQSYKDKGFNMKLRLYEETENMPQIALGFSDFAGTGLFSGEYIVASKRFGNFDISGGIGWGIYANGIKFDNPLIELSKSFKTRNFLYDSVGEFDADDYFSGSDSSIFLSASYHFGKNLIFVELDSVGYKFNKLNELQDYSDYKFGYKNTDFFGAILGLEVDDKGKVNFQIESTFNISKLNTNAPNISKKNDSRLINFLINTQDNNISVNEIESNAKDQLIVSIRQKSYSNISDANDVILKSLENSNIHEFNEIIVKNYLLGKEITKDFYTDETKGFYEQAVLGKNKIFKRPNEYPFFTGRFSPDLRLLLGAREGFLYQGLFLKYDSELFFNENTFIDTTLRLSLSNNFDGLFIPPVTTYPEQVRSDVKEYLKGFNDGLAVSKLLISNFQKYQDNYFLFNAGLYEEMFGGFGFEYLNFSRKRTFAYGLEIHKVKKRAYDHRFEFLDYKTTTGHLNLYHHYQPLNLVTHISWGQYLAGDEGLTFDMHKRFKNGAKIGAYFSLTDVSFEDYGEGSFTKGVYISVPFDPFGFGTSTNFNWTPLTKDPAQKLLVNRIFNYIDRYAF